MGRAGHGGARHPGAGSGQRRAGPPPLRAEYRRVRMAGAHHLRVERHGVRGAGRRRPGCAAGGRRLPHHRAACGPHPLSHDPRHAGHRAGGGVLLFHRGGAGLRAAAGGGAVVRGPGLHRGRRRPGRRRPVRPLRRLLQQRGGAGRHARAGDLRGPWPGPRNTPPSRSGATSRRHSGGAGRLPAHCDRAHRGGRRASARHGHGELRCRRAGSAGPDRTADIGGASRRVRPCGVSARRGRGADRADRPSP